MESTVDIRTLEEWMYAISQTLDILGSEADAEARKLLHTTLDDMRERRAQASLRRHNELGV